MDYLITDDDAAHPGHTSSTVYTPQLGPTRIFHDPIWFVIKILVQRQSKCKRQILTQMTIFFHACLKVIYVYSDVGSHVSNSHVCTQIRNWFEAFCHRSCCLRPFAFLACCRGQQRHELPSGTFAPSPDLDTIQVYTWTTQAAAGLRLGFRLQAIFW